MTTQPREALAQPPFDTSLLGVVSGAMRHYGLDHAPEELFVLSGHAFAINMHRDLCPSSPYCWATNRCVELLANLGLEFRALGMLAPGADAEDKHRLEDEVRAELERGGVCSLLNLDHQLILGHQDAGFALAQPWGPEAPSTPARLTFGTWAECQSGPPVGFFRLAPCPPRSATPLADAVDFAVGAWRRPTALTETPYGFGPNAYEHWLAALERDDFDEHGNWWNASVWGECRRFAGRYFSSLGEDAPDWLDVASAQWLGERYGHVSERLRGVADHSRPVAARRSLVAEARELDAACIERLEGLRSGAGTVAAPLPDTLD